MTRPTLAILVLTAGISLSPAFGQDPMAAQEKCSALAKRFFIDNDYHEVSQLNGKTWFFSYECHYNQKLNKCLILISGKSPGRNYISSIDLIDINENKTIAEYMNEFNKKGILQFRNCSYGEISLSTNAGRDFDPVTKKWVSPSKAAVESLKHPFSDLAKDGFDQWVNAYMTE